MKLTAGLALLFSFSLFACASAPPPTTASADTSLWSPPDAWEMNVAEKPAEEAPAPKVVRAHASDHPNVASKAKSQLFVLGRKSR